MRQEKQILLEQIKGHIDRYKTFVIMRYQGLPTNKINDFRRDVANMGGDVEFVRKRVMIKAAVAAGVPLEIDMLPGHVGLIFAGKDPLELAKYVFKFSKDNDTAVSVLGGQFEGELYNAAQMEMLSNLPSKDEMRAQLLATLESPLSQTLAVMEAILTSVPYCLDNKCKQHEEK